MNKTIITIATLLALNVSFAQETGTATPSKPRLEDINKLLELGGQKSEIDGMIPAILQQLEVSKPLPDTQKNILLAELEPAINHYKEQLIGYFLNEYTAEDVRQMLANYETPIGKKTLQNTDKFTAALKEAYVSIRSSATAALEKVTAGNSKKRTQFEVH